MVALRAKWDQGYTVQLLSTCTPTVSEYLAGAEQHLQRYQLPLGAKLTVVDLANQRWQLQIPKIQFFGIFIQCVPAPARSWVGLAAASKPSAATKTHLMHRPCADVRLYTPQGELQVRTEGVSIEGSKQVTDLGLQHRYDVDVNVDIVAQSDDAFHAASDLTLYVDVPFPFSMTPKPVLAATGNAVVAALLASLMRGFCGIVVADIEGEYSGSGAMK